MNESKYSVAIDGTMVAQGMNLETTLILVKGLFETYYAEPKISICIEVEDETEVSQYVQHVESVGEDGSALKHGHWEMKKDPYRFFDAIPVCSECGCTTEMRKTYNYCPNCGTKMDERGDAE